MKLYRYRSNNSQDLARTFTDCKLYFASPTQFNDPFDCNPPFSNEYTVDDLRCHYRKAYPVVCNKAWAKLSDSQREEIVEEKIKSIKGNDIFQSEFAETLIKSLLEENSKLGVLCLTERPDDIVMWSHYANGHQGLVLQFDKPKLESVEDFSYCRKIDYENNIITLQDMNMEAERPEDLARMLLLKKSTRWKYEEEWRIIVMPNRREDFPNCRIYKFPTEALSGVILGCKMKPEDKYNIIMWLKGGFHRAVIYEAIKETGAYSLRIEECKV